jgi:hypothetical protein
VSLVKRSGGAFTVGARFRGNNEGNLLDSLNALCDHIRNEHLSSKIAYDVLSTEAGMDRSPEQLLNMDNANWIKAQLAELARLAGQHTDKAHQKNVKQRLASLLEGVHERLENIADEWMKEKGRVPPTLEGNWISIGNLLLLVRFLAKEV